MTTHNPAQHLSTLNVNTNNCTDTLCTCNPNAATCYKGARRWMSKMNECIAGWGGSSSCAEHREELELQSGGGVKCPGWGWEARRRRWVWANQRDDPTVNHTSEWESVGDVHCLIWPHLTLRGVHLQCETLTLRRRWFMCLSEVQLMGPSVENSRG